MRLTRQVGFASLVAAGCVAIGCGSAGDTGVDPIGSQSSLVKDDTTPTPNDSDANCKKAEAKDVLIAELVKNSWLAQYPLTRLSVSAGGDVVGPADLPELLAGHLEIVNSVPEVRASVVAALEKVTGLPDYNMAAIGPDTEACNQVPAWTPNGTTVIATAANWVLLADDDPNNSWKTTHKEFGKQCPLIKTVGNRDVLDPAGDGSTSDPVSSTVSATGVTANAYGICPLGTTPGTYCKLSYATGINYTGRKCTSYYTSVRCLIY